MKELSYYFSAGIYDTGKHVHKLTHFGEIYEEFLAKFKDKPTTLLEMGIAGGGCLQLWRDYLGEKSKIFGADHIKDLLYEDKQIKCFYCNQFDKESLNNLKTELNTPLDIIIDDASHFCNAQIMTFETMFPMLNKSGLYFCEDTHTSYRSDYGGGYKKEGTFIEYCKELVDSMSYREDANIPRLPLIDSIYSICFYLNLVVIKHT